jgi:polysaccharide biosynthesis/export protein
MSRTLIALLCSSFLPLAAATCLADEGVGSDVKGGLARVDSSSKTLEAAASGSRPPGLTATKPPGVGSDYQVQPGDQLQVTVWKEQDLSTEVLVRPDGAFSYPLVGDLTATGKTVDQLRVEITDRLKRYIPNPVVTVATKTIGGNHVYVVGKVQRPGEYPFARPLDVMQALSLAGGTTPYASLNDIVILHRDNGAQRAIRFRYLQVARGRDLGQNIVLQSGDTVVVP